MCADYLFTELSLDSLYVLALFKKICHVMYQPKSATNFDDCRKEEIDEEVDLSYLLRTFVDDPITTK